MAFPTSIPKVEGKRRLQLLQRERVTLLSAENLQELILKTYVPLLLLSSYAESIMMALDIPQKKQIQRKSKELLRRESPKGE